MFFYHLPNTKCIKCFTYEYVIQFGYYTTCSNATQYSINGSNGNKGKQLRLWTHKMYTMLCFFFRDMEHILLVYSRTVALLLIFPWWRVFHNQLITKLKKGSKQLTWDPNRVISLVATSITDKQPACSSATFHTYQLLTKTVSTRKTQ